MKLATYQDGSRDGQLIVVSRDLATAHFATGIASRMQQLLDDWNFLSPQLEDLSVTLNQGKARHAFPFDARLAMAPLPRACAWAEAQAYPSHVERLRHAQGLEVPPDLRDVPALAYAAGDAFLGPCDAVAFPAGDAGLDFGAGFAVVSGDVAAGTGAAPALDAVRLVMLACTWTLRDPGGTGAAPGPWRPATAFGPVAVTPDELGPAWAGGRLALPLATRVNGRAFGRADGAAGMHFHFGALIAQLAATRPLRAGSVLGSGPVSAPGSPAGGERGCACIAERRAVELTEHGGARTGYLQPGDTVAVEVDGADGLSVFGAIEQRVAVRAVTAP